MSGKAASSVEVGIHSEVEHDRLVPIVPETESQLPSARHEKAQADKNRYTNLANESSHFRSARTGRDTHTDNKWSQCQSINTCEYCKS